MRASLAPALLLIMSCSSAKPVEKPPEAPPRTASVAAATAPKEAPPAPEALYRMRCLSCHSGDYVEGQPPFPKEKWDEILEKHTSAYGAELSGSERETIVALIVASNGKLP